MTDLDAILKPIMERLDGLERDLRELLDVLETIAAEPEAPPQQEQPPGDTKPPCAHPSRFSDGHGTVHCLDCDKTWRPDATGNLGSSQ